MRKLINIFLGLLVVASIVTSCSDDFLEVTNPNVLAADNFYTTPFGFRTALNSCYTPPSHTGWYGKGYQFIYGSLDDRFLFESTKWDEFIFTADEGNVKALYDEYYRLLFRTSSFLDNAVGTSVEGFDAGELDALKGQAYALRGLAYFNLVVSFHKPVFYTTPPTDAFEKYSNGEPIEFWSQLEQDLDSAFILLPNTKWTGDNVGRINKYAASALLAKALLFKSYYYRLDDPSYDPTADLTKAKLLLEGVMSSGWYSLVLPKAPLTDKDYIYAFQSNFSFTDMITPGGNAYKARNNSESVWEIQYMNGPTTNVYLPGWLAPGSMFNSYFGPLGYKNQAPTKELAEVVFQKVSEAAVPFEKLAYDPRRYVTVWAPGDTMDFRKGAEYNRGFKLGADLQNNSYYDQGYGYAKYNSPVFSPADGTGAPNNAPANWRMIRYADVLLMYAEVCLNLGVEAEAQDEFDQIRDRVGMKRLPLSRETLVAERDREFAGESMRFLDIIRWSFVPEWESVCGAPEVLIKGFEAGKDEFLPIPLVDININKPVYNQNTGW